MRTATMALAALTVFVGGTALAEGMAQGAWTVKDGAYSAAASDRSLYYLTDQPYINGQGTVEALITPKKSLRSAGWGTAAIVLTMGPSDYWTLGLVEGPASEHYTELLEDFQGLHQAQSTGPTRLSAIEGTYGFDWQYGHTYRLVVTLAGDNLVGDVFEGDNTKPLAHLGWQLGATPALREGWGGLRCEMMEAEFTQVKVTAPAAPPSRTPRQYPQGGNGCVGLYFGDDLPGGETPPALDEMTKRLWAAGFETARLTSLDLAHAGTLWLPAVSYLVADLRHLPQGAAPRILGWMRQGGILVSLTAPAFGDTFYRAGNAWQTWDEFSQHGLAEMAGKGREVVPWSEATIADWQQTVYAGMAPAKLAVKDAATPSGDAAVVMNAPGFVRGWWSLGTTFAAPPIHEGESLTCFWAKGDEHTPEMSVELAEDDGSRWIAVVSLAPKWRYYALPPQAFSYWQDNPSKGRGGAGDALRPAHAVRLAFGISGSHTPSVLVPDVPVHQISIGPLRAATVRPENLSALAPAPRPELEALSPGYKLHEVTGAKTWQATDIGQLWGLPGKLPVVPSLSAIRRPEGEGFDRGYWWRWVPLIEARDASGKYCGAPMSMLISEMMPMPRTAWVSVGLEKLADFGPEMQRAVAAVIDRLAKAPVLVEGGAESFLWRPGEKIGLGAKIVNPAGPKAEVKVATILKPEAPGAGTYVLTGPGTVVEPRGISTVRLTTMGIPSGKCQVTTELSVGGKVVDRIAHPMTIEAAPTAPPPASEVVERRGGGLYLDGKPWHPVACNYWPHTLGGVPTNAYTRGWMDPMLYDPEVAEADLAQLESWHFRAIAAVGAELNWRNGEKTVRNVLDFLDRCQRHHVKVFLFVGGLDPRGRNDALATEIIKTVRYCPAIAGYDVAWEPGYWEWSSRHRYAQQWRGWLEAQYGGIGAAEAALACKIPRDDAGQVDAPPDSWFTKDGAWRQGTAAFRTFWNWQMGAEYRHTAALIHSLDKVHLVGFRGSSVGGPLDFMPVEQPAVLHFMDWAGPEDYDVPAYGRISPWAYISAEGLVTRMLSYTSGGKPIVWMEYGMPIYPNGTIWKDELIFLTPERLAYQATEGRQFWQMQSTSGAWGSMAWWYPGGWRTGENSECGLVDPDNRPRPVGEAEAGFVDKFTASETFKPDTYLEFKPEQVGGWVGEYLRLRPQYAALVAQGHKVGVKTVGPMSAADCPLIDPSGAAWTGKGPLRYLDAIFERIRVKVGDEPWIEVPLPTTPEAVAVKVSGSGPVQIEAWVGSLAEAKWLPGGVVLTVSGDGKGEGALDKAVEFQGSGHFGPVKVGEGMGETMNLRLQLEAPGRAAFGEIINLKLVHG